MMSWLRTVSFLASLTVMAGSSGCCLFHSSAGNQLGGLESYYHPTSADPGCTSCAQGSLTPGCGLGLGCIGKLLGIGRGACYGCGETYYHGWVNDPPSCDPCDGNGNWIGSQTGSLCGCGGVGCNLCGMGAVEPGCGLADTCGCGRRHRPVFQLPGRTIYATWTGMVGLVHEIHRGFPTCHHCHSFSLTRSCNSCNSCDAVPSCDCSTDVGCSCGSTTNDCGCDVSSHNPGPVAEEAFVVPSTQTAHVPGQLPHRVVRAEMMMNHGRPPHPVLSNRMPFRR